MRLLTTLVQIAGLAAIVAAAWLLAPVAGLFVAGLMLVVVGHAVDEERK